MRRIFNHCFIAIIMLGISTVIFAQNASKPQMVDMGLSVKWANMDLGATSANTYGELCSATTDVTKQLGEGWRVPTKEEFEELCNNCDKSFNIVNGVVKAVVFTSKKNGAQISFYVPPICMSNSMTSISLKNPQVKGKNKMYNSCLLFNGSKSGFFTICSVESADADLKKFKSELAKLGLSGSKYEEWPDELRRQASLPEDVFMSDNFEYVGTVCFGEAQMGGTCKLSIRPVYSVDDDDIEDSQVSHTNNEVYDNVDNDVYDNADNEVYDNVEQAPQYPGGMAEMTKWLSSNIHYPAVAKENGIEGRVIVSFVIECDGTITGAKVVRSVEPSLDKEALRLVTTMPKWTPGKQGGKVVRVRYTLPVVFRNY